jgi:DNA-binding SARP family transcriptional activator/TolB-like protein/tetratricopeptide (TPR) repeat protein
MAVYSLSLFGDPLLRGPGGVVTGRAAYRRRIALLSILALARGRPVGRERLIGLLWPEHPSDAARHTLSEALYVLRKDLSDDLFVAVGDEIGLNREVMGSDVADFEEALDALHPEAAVRAYGGPLLDGFYVAEAPEFERWVDGERDRLARAYARTLESIAGAAETQGDLLGAAQWWRRLAAHDPYNSRVALRLVNALDAAGDRVGAFRFADTHALLLREELGADPDPELTRLVERLRTEPLRVPALPPRTVDAAPLDAKPADAEPVDTETVDAETVDAEPADTKPVDAAPVDAEPVDAEPVDTKPVDRGEADARVVDAAGAAALNARASSREGEAEGGEADPAGEDAGPAAWTATDAAAAGVDAPTAGSAAVRIERSEAPGEAAEAEGRGTGTPPASRPARVPRRAWLVGAGGLAAAAVLAISVAAARGGDPAPAAPRYDPRRIAVLYLDDYSPGGELGYLANGLTEMLIHELSQVEALDVVSRNGVKPYRDGTVPFDTMVADLRAGSVVEGSVQRSGDSIRVTIQLIDANSQAHLESRSLVRPLGAGGVFALQNEVAAEVTAFLRRRVGREIRLSSLRRQAADPRAFELVLRASQATDDARELARSTHPRDMRSALRMLGQADSMLARAAAMDPRWAEPELQRGLVQLERGRLLPPAAAVQAFHAAGGHAEAVLRRDPRSVDARELRGHALWQMVNADPGGARGRPWMADAERDLRAVLEADPRRASAWATLGQLLRVGGDLAEAELAARRGREEDAYLDVPDQGAERLYRAAFALGDLPRARHWCDEGRRQFPADYRFRECALVLLARGPAPPAPDSAWRLLAAADGVDPPAAARAAGRPYSPVFRQAMVAAVLARAGLADSARAVADRSRGQAGRAAETRASFLWDDAYLQVLLGDTARAAALLDRYVAERPVLRDYVAREPVFRGVWRGVQGAALPLRRQ